MAEKTILQDLRSLIYPREILEDEPLSKYTFTKTGGKADILIFPETYEEVQKTVRFASLNGVPYTILGNGSNLIIKDGGIRGIVLILTKLAKISHTGNDITAQCGAAIIDVSRYALKQNLTGLEFACGIPGSVGGALYMNAGAYGGEIKDVLKSALVLTKTGKMKRLEKSDLSFQYRKSSIAENGEIALEGTFSLKPGDAQEIKAKMDELTYLRESKQPLEYPSCGSVFKRPPGYFAGKLIQDSGLQGKRIGGVEVSTKHAGFMVNVGGGTATDYMNLIKFVQKTVKEKFGVDLETEVKIIGED
ncbi:MULTISPECIES: UDP-N-acetylmuramate dehydrogenase [Heyndrickxia]|jgi:UDP-N-acetylmuramate dehydrogenase|uniref:UDP-N-acetylenolpyruvoylglucosamine reductase n=1 Tax=Heyndrickxia coagulans DSM 1 = ATCC 7050 TaxID=1121088 RepID=A0A8B4BW04_HEYCO|nr:MULTISPECIES: UDP-N-acetylmuramate dehydrogenase [Heyndrickxia]AJH79415.1 UDP-N-acetylenolpyruvoylglucosamine reductase [Heyndrickxia coagulans DSM 1 = ATCC 7050]MBF8417813.1 UDP-N-acetylmuramate dehydrogenase [Heyndrickxia coagulans]MCR2847074.1 UDP-N-acetylmuramate dehydrogenase [Heyndrickxia coagulans]MDR4224740.1 UDP-N-acetylmuramate dehydrogenase [Heyndrickxia coagulans DSM 1 = ATCC 7050]MEC2306303.1 UDP-N-acetylmuramate dehydrogenase [Weizmannia sp. CD-2023]